MSETPDAIRDHIITAALPHVPFEGWTAAMLERAALDAGYPRDMVHAVFPAGVGDAVAHFSDLFDRAMLTALEKADVRTLRIRDKIRLAVQTRLDLLQPHKEAVRLALSFWARPARTGQASKIVWRTADHIWAWAGDTATDYNRTTKRLLLSAVLSSTTLAWLDDKDRDMYNTHAFLERRIENVLQFGRIVGKIVGKIKGEKTFRRAS